MNREYRVIALDMDGTALNDEKKIGERTAEAIHEALAAGKEVVFCTGRSYAEMVDILKDFPDMHYLCGESGALVYDLREKKALAKVSVNQETIDKIRQVVQGRDIMLQFISEGRSVVNRSQLYRMEHYQMGVYQESFPRVCTVVEDVFRMAEEEQCSVEKINLFHTGLEERQKSLEQLEERQVPATMVFSEISSLECSPRGLNKAVGLGKLCDTLGITMEQVIMVGDAENDRAALEAAGLAVAMGNASPAIKAICQEQVADNNHDGCGEAIRRFLLGSMEN